MSDLWAIGLPILLVDIANPVLMAGVIMGLSAKKPVVTSLAVVAGHTLSYFACGLLIIFGLTALLERLLAPLIDSLDNPEPWHYVVGAIIGLLLIVVSWRWRTDPPDPAKKQPEKVETGLFPAFLFGAAVSVAGTPFALPYFAFINRLYDLGAADKAAALAVYNAFYALPFLLIPIAFAALGKSVLSVLDRINRFFETASAYLIPAVLGLLGLVLVLDAALFFSTGDGLLPSADGG